MKKLGHVFLFLMTAIMLLTSCGFAVAADYPDSAITLVVCASPGGDSDINARFFAEELTKRVGQPVVVVNTTGGSGAIGVQSVLDAGTNGYTAVFYHTSLTLGAISGSLEHLISEDFDIVACPIQDSTTGWFVAADSPYQTINDVVEAAKAAPNTVTFATEVGASTYAAMLMLENITGCDLLPVDVGTSAEKQAALLSGIVNISSFQYSVAKDFVSAGQFRCLGVLADERCAACPDVPTFKEQGIDLVLPRYFMMAFPKGTDQAVLDYWKGVMSELCADTAFQEAFFAATGAEVVPDPVAGIELWLKQENDLMGIKDLMTK